MTTSTQPLPSRRAASSPGARLLGRLNIGRKLTVGFGILVLLTLATIALSVLGSNSATREINRTSEVRAPIALAAARAHASLLGMVGDMRGYLALGDKALRDDYLAAQQEFEQNLRELEERSRSNGAPIQGLDTLQQQYAAWRQLPARLFDLHDDQLQREPALRMLIKEGSPPIVQISQNIKLLIDARAQGDQTADGVALIKDLASFQGSFTAFRWRTSESNDEIPYSHHGYAYALGDPILLTDPSGRYAAGDDSTVQVNKAACDAIRWQWIQEPGTHNGFCLPPPPPPNNEQSPLPYRFDSAWWKNAQGTPGSFNQMLPEVEEPSVLPPETKPKPQPPSGGGGISNKKLGIFAIICAAAITGMLTVPWPFGPSGGQPPRDRLTPTPEEYITVFHYTSKANAEAIATTGTYHANIKGPANYGMYVTTYNHQSGYGGYRLSKQELQFGLRSTPRSSWSSQSVDGYVKFRIPRKLLKPSGQPYFYSMSRRGSEDPEFPDVTEDEQRMYNSIRKNLLNFALPTYPSGLSAGSIDIRQYIVEYGDTLFR